MKPRRRAVRSAGHYVYCLLAEKQCGVSLIQVCGERGGRIRLVGRTTASPKHSGQDYETTGLYGIKRKALIKNRSRVGKNPYFHEVSDEEAIDLDNHKDFEYLEYYVKKNLYRAD